MIIHGAPPRHHPPATIHPQSRLAEESFRVPQVFDIAPIASAGVSTADGLLLVLISLVGGIGITAIGPGGVLVTIALFALTDLSPAEVAGTAIVTHVGTGLVGTVAFLRSGQLRDRATRRLAAVLGVAALICTPLGTLVNARVSSAQFGLLLAVFVMAIGLTVIVRDIRGDDHDARSSPPRHGLAGQSLLGGTVAAISGIFGVGGPILAVPALVIAGYPMLAALAAAQAQSVVVAGTGTVAYLAQGAISWPLAVLTGVPEMVGVWIGWKVAHAVPTRPLKYALAGALVALGPVLLLTR
jgi:uncharacterized membrane protein YfcA